MLSFSVHPTVGGRPPFASGRRGCWPTHCTRTVATPALAPAPTRCPASHMPIESSNHNPFPCGRDTRAHRTRSDTHPAPTCSHMATKSSITCPFPCGRGAHDHHHAWSRMGSSRGRERHDRPCHELTCSFDAPASASGRRATPRLAQTCSSDLVASLVVVVVVVGSVTTSVI